MMKFTRAIAAFVFSLIFFSAWSQAPHQPNSAEIFQKIQKSQVLASALYVAAHPDDENTSMISYLANEAKAEIAYISLTRGDGGQNLIGTEIQELLGLLRTQELLAARRIDGGNQMFSRAIDFGFSKHPDETLEIWNKKEVLGDLVWAIRKWQPDIIINRFDHNSAGRTHGHHTASAVLSVDAWDLVGDKSAYPEQLKYVDTWQPSRLYYNTSWWQYGSREAFEKVDKSNMAAVDVGVYYPLLGSSNNEIAGLSRSQHRCQGMGRYGSRGSSMEYLEILEGKKPDNKDDLFGGIDITWTRVKGGKEIGEQLKKIENTFDFANPGKSVPALVQVLKKINALPDGHWKNIKQKEVKAIISDCLGLFAEAIASDYSATPGSEVEINFEAITRANSNVKLQSISIQPMGIDTSFGMQMTANEDWRYSKKVNLPKDIAYTNPYWLNEAWDLGTFTVKDQQLRGLPETPRDFKVKWNWSIEGMNISYETPVVYKKDDPVKGETYRPFEITPPVFANLADKVYVFSSDAPKTIQVSLKSGKMDVKGTLKLDLEEGWRAEPEMIDFELAQKGEEKTFNFALYPPADQSVAYVKPQVMVDGKTYDREIIIIEYDHIPTQTVFRTSQAKVVKINLTRMGNKVGYFMGAGDEIPQSLNQIGYDVAMLNEKDLNAENLSQYDAVIMGIRAYNTHERLKFAQPELMKYVENGGTLLMQYNTTWDLSTKDLGPYPFKISRDRVTVEDAPITFLKPDHPVLNFPNKITQEDFDGWIQERGLYFPDEWDENYEAILSANDPGEEPKNGSLLVAKYGKGYFVYTGLSMFRELPAGVPGAYRLFTNMISLGKKP
ncbi:MAG: PIG-L family deacetylase [Saprospiraceae bacterium]